MTSLSLDFTATAYADMYNMIAYKLYYKMEDQTTVWDAWYADVCTNGNGSSDEQTAAGCTTANYDGRAMTIGVDEDYLSMITNPVFVRKYSGICLEDYSSSKGGFCLLENNDTDFTGLLGYVTQTIYPLDSNGAADTSQQPNGDSTNRVIETYRLSQAQFTTMSTAWEDTAVQDASGMQDGRVFQQAIASQLVDTSSSANIEYLDYPNCSVSGNDWTCKLYLRAMAQQIDGYPAFVTPGVISAYFVASYVPDQKDLSYNKVTDFIVYDSAVSAVTYSAALLAGVATLMF